MKKYTLLFATMLAMSGMAFGQVLPKVLWETNVTPNIEFTSVNELYDIYSSINGNSMIKRRFNITSRFGSTFSDIGVKTLSKNGKIQITSENLYKNRSQGGGIATVNYLKNYSFIYGNKSIFAGDLDTLFLLNQDFQLEKEYSKKDVGNYPIAVENGFIFSYPKLIIKFDIHGKEEWRYESQEEITLLNRTPPYFCTLGITTNKKSVILDKNGKIVNASETLDNGFPFPINDKGLGIIYASSTNPDNTNISKYDSTGKLIAKISLKGLFPNSYNPTSLIKLMPDNSVLLTFYTETKEVYFAKIEDSGKIKTYKTSLLSNTLGYQGLSPFFEIKIVDNSSVMYYAFSVDSPSQSGINCRFGVANLDSNSLSWEKRFLYKSLGNIDPPVTFEANNTIFQAYPSTTKPTELSFTTYNSKGEVIWNSPFSNKTVLGQGYKEWKIIDNFLYTSKTNNGLNSVAKIKFDDGTFVWEKTGMNIFNFKEDILVDDTSNEYILYEEEFEPDKRKRKILAQDKKSNKLWEYTFPLIYITPQYSYQRLISQFVLGENKTIYTLSAEKNLKGIDELIYRKITPCSYNFSTSLGPVVATTQILTQNGSTEACPGEKIRLYAPPYSGAVFEWTRDGKIVPELKEATHDMSVSGTYKVTIKDTVCLYSGISNEVKVTIRTLPTAEVTAPKSIFCDGDKTIMTATTNGTFFQWQKDQKDIPNATSGIFEVSEAGNYRVGVRDDKCPQVGYSNVYTIITKLLPEANISTDVKGVVYEPFTVKMTANSGTGLAYQWLKDDAIIPNETKQTYEAQKSGKYKVNVTYDGCTKLSDALTISILIPLANQEEIGEEQVQVYPNPSKGEFKIILPKSLKSADVQLFDSFGRERSLVYIGEKAQVDGLAQGVYFLRIQNGERSVVNKIVIE
jgi:Secretion system C-terminal sorting domain